MQVSHAVVVDAVWYLPAAQKEQEPWDEVGRSGIGWGWGGGAAG